MGTWKRHFDRRLSATVSLKYVTLLRHGKMPRGFEGQKAKMDSGG